MNPFQNRTAPKGKKGWGNIYPPLKEARRKEIHLDQNVLPWCDFNSLKVHGQCMHLHSEEDISAISTTFLG